MKPITKLWLIGTSLITTACISPSNELSEGFCTDTNWLNQGEQVALKGQSVRVVNKYRKTCKGAISEDDLYSFQDGYLKGIIQYCSEVKGYELGRRGDDFNDVCPDELANNFTRGYNHGKTLYNREMTNLERMKRDQLRIIESQQSSSDSTYGQQTP
ncbi:MAG: hypothetical protein COA42_13075 [Alteromonadaceae bacterium]|nr:MAG: hypothetical protein COA42_13075 [Alteromonadaceae bacterium]